MPHLKKEKKKEFLFSRLYAMLPVDPSTVIAHSLSFLRLPHFRVVLYRFAFFCSKCPALFIGCRHGPWASAQALLKS